MKQSEIKDMSQDQIVERVGALRKEELNLRFQQASGQLKDTARVKRARRDIAQLKTEWTRRRRTEAGEGE